MVFLIPEAQWLLCIWQARRARAPWWAVTVIILCVQLSKHMLEKLASFNPDTPDKKRKGNAGWPELLRAAIGITVSVYIVRQILWDIGGQNWVTAIMISLLILSGVLDYALPTSRPIYGLVSVLACVGVLWKESAARGVSEGDAAGGLEWFQLVLSTHALAVGYVVPIVEGEKNNGMERIIPLFCVIILTTTTTTETQGGYHFLFLLLPAIFLKEKQAVTVCIAPILDQICHPGLYPLLDPKKNEARNILLVQQKQEILIYIMSWCVVVGLWAHARPSVLLWVQVIGGVLYLASLRRYANVVRILEFNSSARRHDNKSFTARPRTTTDLHVLTKMMELPSSKAPGHFQ